MTESPTEAPAAPNWRPLDRMERRVLGVLIEKAKTTPDAYPLTLNALVNGCNQKSNRSPLMNVEPDDLEPVLERLRHAGVVVCIEGSGRVAKYRHLAYEWFGVSKEELAVLAELLLRGPQTEGELRGRADRMDRIADLSALRPLVDSLKAKKLMIGLTPPGRGHVVTHNVYPPEELEKVRREAGNYVASSAGDDEPAVRAAAPPRRVESAPAPRAVATGPVAAPGVEPSISAQELAELRQQIAELRSELAEVAALAERTAGELRQVRDALGG